MSDILKNRLLQKVLNNTLSNDNINSGTVFKKTETVIFQNEGLSECGSSKCKIETKINDNIIKPENREKISDPLDVCVAQIDTVDHKSLEAAGKTIRKNIKIKIKDGQLLNCIVKKLTTHKIMKTSKKKLPHDQEKQVQKPKQEFTCNECGKKVYNKGSFHTHVRSHSSEKPSRHVSTEAPKRLTCDHEKNNFKKFECHNLKYEDIKKFHDAFYQNKSKILQDAMILKYVNVYPPSRVLSKNSPTTKKNYIANFFVPGENDKLYSVCKSSFLDILSITRTRVNGVIARFFATGKMPTERRGGDRRSSPNKNKLICVQDFIKTFDTYKTQCCHCYENKIYLDESMSVIKMWKLYQNHVEKNPELQVKDSWFRYVFNKYFNINVGSPKKNPCSSCVELAKKSNQNINSLKSSTENYTENSENV